MATKTDPRKLATAAPFKDLFPVDLEVVNALAASMRQRGYDAERPIVAWRPNGSKSEPVVVEGHMRLAAAVKARVPQVWVAVRKFKNEDEAFSFAISEQRDRRNLTKLEIAEAIARAETTRQGVLASVAKTSPAGGRPADPAKAAVVEKSATVGVSERTARRGLANVRAEQAEATGEAPSKPRRKPRAKSSPAPTLPTILDTWRDGSASTLDKLDMYLVDAAAIDSRDLAAEAKACAARSVQFVQQIEATLDAYLKATPRKAAP